jgi:TRAP-type uncharacterized transport system substrate-binding protein
LTFRRPLAGVAKFTLAKLLTRRRYAAVQTIDERQAVIPIDDDKPLDTRNLCRSTEKCPLQIPLHPGALKYYKKKGYM